MPSILDRITALFARSNPATKATPVMDIPRRHGDPLDILGSMQADNERRQLVKTCREMYAKDTRAKGVLSTVSRDIVHGGYEVVVTKGRPDAADIANQLYERIDLGKYLDDWIRLAMRDGDSFLELGVNQASEIVEVTRKPTLQMRRNSDDKDRFPDPARAFWQGPEYNVSGEVPPDAVWYAQWQIIHARWDHDAENRYGTPLFASATGAYKRIREGETDIAVRRKTRAGIKYNHRFPEGTTPDQIEAYKEVNRDQLDDPTAAIADFFGTAEINVVQGEGGALEAIGDVMHHIRTWWLASPVPMSLLGYGQDLNRDVLDAQQGQYERALEGLVEWVEGEIVKPLIERQWLLAGIDPAGLEYEIKWKTRQALTVDVLRQVAWAVLKLTEAGLTNVQAWSIAERFLPGVDMTEIMAEMERRSAQMQAQMAGKPKKPETELPDADDDEEEPDDGLPGEEEEPGREEALIMERAAQEYQRAAELFERVLREA